MKQEKFDAQENTPVPSTAVREKQEHTPFGTLPRKKDSVDDKLALIGELIIDEDVFLALNHLKEVGVAIRQGKARNVSSSNTQRSLLSAYHVDDNDDKDESSDHSVSLLPSSIKKEPEHDSFASFKSKMFTGMKRHTEDSFSEIFGTKKRGKGTPSHGGPGTPLRSPKNQGKTTLEMNLAHTEAKGKTADAGNQFLKKKKVTSGNLQTCFKAIRDKGRDITDYNEEKNSFYLIISHYFDSLWMVPEDQRPSEIKSLLYNFVMRNNEYTKVNMTK